MVNLESGPGGFSYLLCTFYDATRQILEVKEE